MENYQSFLDATPEKGVIIVEYYWQAHPSPINQADRKEPRSGSKTSMAFFKPMRASDECWCGSGRRFSRCHRRKDDWTYVTLDPGHSTYSPVVLLERTYSVPDGGQLRMTLEGASGLLPVEKSESLTEWCVPIEPATVHEMGQLVLGTIGLSQNQVHLQTNSDKRFTLLTEGVRTLLGDSLGEGSTIRAEPQQAIPAARRARKRSK